ncbi:MAG: hypothetical protein HVN35_09620 [Methanobacteriaceae archaeon]|nr:hypothetical protein [Methanobacteriaceae archaeon]
MADNSPSIKEWKELYQKATEFKKLKPWEWMWDEQIFAVKNPETGETAYCTVMGRMQSFYGMAAYLGPEGLENYCDIQSGRITPDDPDAFFQQRVLVVSFEDRDDIEDEDYQIIRKLGLRFRGKNQWPLFRSFRPHYMPWYLDGDEARFLTLILEQAIIVGQGIKEDPELLTPPVLGKIFTRIPDHKGEWKDSWTDPTDDEGCVSESNDEEESISKVNMGEVSLPDKVTDET